MKKYNRLYIVFIILSLISLYTYYSRYLSVKKIENFENSDYNLNISNISNIFNSFSFEDKYKLIGTGKYGCAFRKNNDVIKITVFNYQGIYPIFKKDIDNELAINIKLKEIANKDQNYNKYFTIMTNYILVNKDGDLINNNNNQEYDNFPTKSEIQSFIKPCWKNYAKIGHLQESYVTNDITYLLLKMPYGGISFNKYLEERKDTITNHEFVILMNKIFQILKLLHQADVFHGDFNIGNILIDENDNPRIIDFSQSMILNKSSEEMNTIAINYFKNPNIIQNFDFKINLTNEFTAKDIDNLFLNQDQWYIIMDLMSIIETASVFTLRCSKISKLNYVGYIQKLLRTNMATNDLYKFQTEFLIQA